MRKTRLLLEQMQKELSDLKQTVVTQELVRLREESKRFNDVKEDLKNVHFRIKTAREIENEDGHFFEVTYAPIKIVMNIDDDGKISRNEFFRSVNRLNLLSNEDFILLEKEIAKIKNKAKKVK